MRTPIIAGNWKMNTSLSEATALVRELLTGGLASIAGVEKVLCPPFISLSALTELLRDTTVKIGAQNMYFQEKGAFTGEISPLMLKELCQYVVLGHSERRAYFAEDDDIVNKKVKAAIKVGLNPILCVGERLEERETGKTEAVITRQVRGGLEGLDSLTGLVVAYEPVWAIGTGKAAQPQDAVQVVQLIRRLVGQIMGAKAAAELRVQYGGSVTPANVAAFMREPDIDGALVGGASLKAADFLSIVEQSAALKR